MAPESPTPYVVRNVDTGERMEVQDVPVLDPNDNRPAVYQNGAVQVNGADFEKLRPFQTNSNQQ